MCLGCNILVTVLKTYWNKIPIIPKYRYTIHLWLKVLCCFCKVVWDFSLLPPMIMPWCTCAKGIRNLVCVSVCMSVTRISRRSLKNQVLANVVQAQPDNISNLIVLEYWIKALFSSYGVICSPRTLLWHVPDFPDDQSTCSGSPCILILESIQQLQQNYAVNMLS